MPLNVSDSGAVRADGEDGGRAQGTGRLSPKTTCSPIKTMTYVIAVSQEKQVGLSDAEHWQQRGDDDGPGKGKPAARDPQRSRRQIRSVATVVPGELGIRTRAETKSPLGRKARTTRTSARSMNAWY